jgi:hypothetical protein
VSLTKPQGAPQIQLPHITLSAKPRSSHHTHNIYHSLPAGMVSRDTLGLRLDSRDIQLLSHLAQHPT